MSATLLNREFITLMSVGSIVALILCRRIQTWKAAALAHLPPILGIAITVWCKSEALKVAGWSLFLSGMVLLIDVYQALLGICFQLVYHLWWSWKQYRLPRPPRDEALSDLEDRRQTAPVRHRDEDDACRYYYCKSCGQLSDVISADRLVLPATLCGACAQLKIWGWLPNRQR